MLSINGENWKLIERISSIKDVLRLDPNIELDLPIDRVNKLVDDGVPLRKILRAWTGCTPDFVYRIGVDTLTYAELEAIALNPAISRIALENHRFEQLLPRTVFETAMAGMTYAQCNEYRLDIIDVMKVPTIDAKDTYKLIDDAFDVGTLPISSVSELEDLACPVFTYRLARKLMDVEYPKTLIHSRLLSREVIRNNHLYNGVIMLLTAGAYDRDSLVRLLEHCDHYSKYDFIRNLPKIPTHVKTQSWFSECWRSPSTIKYVATGGTFTNSSLNEFIDIIERHGVMADMILLYENRELTEKQAELVRKHCEVTITVADYRPGLFDKFITNGSAKVVADFAVAYRDTPSAMLFLQSPNALARTGLYYMKNLVVPTANFLTEYLIKCSDVEFSDRDIQSLASLVKRLHSDEALMYFLVMDNIPLDVKESTVASMA